MDPESFIGKKKSKLEDSPTSPTSPEEKPMTKLKPTKVGSTLKDYEDLMTKENL